MLYPRLPVAIFLSRQAGPPARTAFRHALFALAFWLGHSGLALAHEFWMLPDTFTAESGAPVQLSLYVGERFQGDIVPFSAEYVTAVRRYTRSGNTDLTVLLPRSSRGGIRLRFPEGGTQLIAVDTHPNRVELAAGKFEDYLRSEGLERILAMRQTEGKANAPGRERYRRHIKTLLSAGGQSDGTASDGTALLRTGQRLEILPLADPLRARAGDALSFRVLFEGEPLAGALVKAWHWREGQLTTIPVRTGQDGRAGFTLPSEGVWMISVVHMLPLANDPAADWESMWGNLTFRLGGAG